MNKPIYITQPNMPPLENLNPYLEQIWQNKILTNNGPLHQRFEKELARYLEVQNVNLFTNATLALIVGLQSLKITGEVITTPFSFVATTHALKWNRITPVFCDIEENTLNLDPSKIESLLSPRVSAIMPVHVYGHPCNTEMIQSIADKFGLRVIYDAAHAFGLKMHQGNILLEGDMSVLSFHATKLFNTFEGGAIITKDEKLKKRIDYLKNFGFADELTIIGTGINAKMNEFQSALGLLGLEIVDQEIENRQKVANAYIERLKSLEGIRVFNSFDDYDYNYAYFPILINKEEFGVGREEVYYELRKNNIYSRRYFYPLISNIPAYRELPTASRELLPVANRISEQVLCLPLYGSLCLNDVDRICDVIGSLKSMSLTKSGKQSLVI